MTVRREILSRYEGVTEWFNYDFANGSMTIEVVQDVEPILDANRKLAADEGYTKHGIKNEMWHYASIPVVVQQQWLNTYGIDQWPMKQGNEKLLMRLLNSPDYKYLKVTEKSHT